MDSFSSHSSMGSGSPQMSAEDFKDQLKNELAQAYAQEFLETVRDKCFAKCITKPGSSLSGSESSCISRCVERYIEATGIISRALFNAPRRTSRKLLPKMPCKLWELFSESRDFVFYIVSHF